jgi:hypothetical protein
VSGYPTITVPMGEHYGLPVGLTFVAGAWSEGTLLKLAYAYEQGTKHRKAPKLLPTLELTTTGPQGPLSPPEAIKRGRGASASASA